MTKKIHLFYTLLLTMLLLSLSGCAGATPIPETPTEGPVEETAPTPELATVSEPEETDYCLDCHADKERLIDTAKPEEIVESENEGAG